MRLTSLALAISTAAIGMPAFAQETITLRIADYLPANHVLYDNGLRGFMEQVEEQSQGRIDFEYYPGEQLGKAKDLLDLVSSGAADIALIAPSYTSEKMPLTTVSELPGLYTTSCEGTHAFIPATGPDGVLGSEFEKNGVRSVISFMYQPADLLTANTVVDAVEDWSGLKVRVAGGPTEIAVGEMGGVAVRMAAADLYQAMSRGTVDGALLVATSAQSYALDTVIEGITTGFSLGSIASAYVMNEQSWQRLPEDLQQIVRQAGDDASMTLCSALDELEQSELARMEKDGITITRLGDEERAAWNDKTQKLLADWSTRIGISEDDIRTIYSGLQPKAE